MSECSPQIETLLQARYGANPPNLEVPFDDHAEAVFEALLSHKSVRNFLPDSLAPGTLELIVAAAQSAASSSNLQTWSVVAVEKPERKAEAATTCGDQDFIRQAPLFLVFCADLARLTDLAAQSDLPAAGLEYLEMFLMAAIDASLAAQNAALAAEALGLGICYVGGARNQPRELSALLELPPRVFALFGMSIGVPNPAKPAAAKPRLPQNAVLHRETYSADAQNESIAAYNAIMRQFYENQKMNVSGEWMQHSAKRIATVEALTGRHILREFLQERGFDLK